MCSRMSMCNLKLINALNYEDQDNKAEMTTNNDMNYPEK